jgi:hypothetical protein
MGFGIEAEESVGDLVGTYRGIVPIARHLPLARTGQKVRVYGQEVTLKVAASPTDASPGQLKIFACSAMGDKRIMNTLIGDCEPGH